jgi:hypothetical protein
MKTFLAWLLAVFITPAATTPAQIAASFVPPFACHAQPSAPLERGHRWERLGGWPGHHNVRGLLAEGDTLYATLAGMPEHGGAAVYRLQNGAWTKLADGNSGLWSADDKSATALVSYNGKLYAGIGWGTAQVWAFDGQSWALGKRFPGHEWAYSMATVNGHLYVGLQGPAALYKFDGKTWTDVSPPWDAKTLGVYSMHAWDGQLFIGLNGDSYGNGGAAVWRLKDGAWAQIGAWPQATHALALTHFNGQLVVSLGRPTVAPAPLHPVWAFDGTGWAKLGHAPDAFARNHIFNDMAAVSGRLYVGVGGRPMNAETVWALDGADYRQIGGQRLNESWPAPCDRDIWETGWVYTMTEYQGRLVIGLAGGLDNKAEVWQLAR